MTFEKWFNENIGYHDEEFSFGDMKYYIEKAWEAGYVQGKEDCFKDFGYELK